MRCGGQAREVAGVDKPVNVRRNFLPWTQPLLIQAVRWLTENWTGDGPLDLSDRMIVVSTRQAGRRLREALAVHAAERRQAVFPPRVVTPDQLLQPAVAGKIAPPLATQLAWAEVLLEISLDEFREVFPVDPPIRNFSWALRLAQGFVELQAQLAEAGRLMAEVERQGGDFPESARWRQLGELARRQMSSLRRVGWEEEQSARIEAARRPAVPAGVQRISVLAVPDPHPLALECLRQLSAVVEVGIVVYAPPEEADNFDAWGRPMAERWAQRELLLPEFSERVHLAADPAAQAELLARLTKKYDEPEGLLAIGVADAAVLSPLENALRAEGFAVFNAEGRSFTEGALHHLLSCLAELAKEPDFAAVERLARCPAFADYLGRRLGEGFSWSGWLAGLDGLRARHLPATLASALRLVENAGGRPGCGPALAIVEEVRARLAGPDFARGASGLLAEIFAGKRLNPREASDEQFAVAAEAWMETVEQCAVAGEAYPGLKVEDWWELALRDFGAGRTREDKPAGMVELSGWLELLWEDAPHLAVAGLNEGCVPESVSGHAYLPESLRARLGLKTNEVRFARDAYLLQALAHARQGGGRLDLVYGKESAEGDPLRPSRLLLRCADAELPARVKFLFRPPPPAGPLPAWSRAWQNRPPVVPASPNVNVTSLRAWLKCPLRFYFRHVLKMQAVDPAKCEMDDFDFGTLCHAALEQMGKDPVMLACTEDGVLREFLWTQLDRVMRAKYGAELTLPLLVQRESARQRLAKAAEVQARERAAGWEIIAVERRFELPMAGMTIVGKIDRIERHAASGAVRVLDYKTSDTPKSPEEVHLRPKGKDDVGPAWKEYLGGKKPRIWADLQLPMYLQELRREYEGEVTGGYFNLPKAAGETRLEMWTDFPTDLADSARICAEGVCTAIREGIFWPPRELRGREVLLDEYGALFHQGAAASVAWPEVKA